MIFGSGVCLTVTQLKPPYFTADVMPETLKSSNLQQVRRYRNYTSSRSTAPLSLADQIIRSGDEQVIVAGGMESMSHAPYLNKAMRWGAKMGDIKMHDSMLTDGLTCAFTGVHMGCYGNETAKGIIVAVITASMAGNVWKLLVGKGEAVKAGDEVAILESMKMEIPITAEQDGIVKEVKTSEVVFIN